MAVLTEGLVGSSGKKACVEAHRKFCDDTARTGNLRAVASLPHRKVMAEAICEGNCLGEIIRYGRKSDE